MAIRRHRRSRWLLASILLASAAFVCQLRCSPATTLATFNIEMFPKRETDPERVAQLLLETEADIIAVQEIRDATRFEQVVELAAERSGRDLRLVLSQCVHRPRFLSPGLVYDADHLRLVEVREYAELRPDGRGECSRESLPGVMGVFEDEGGVLIAAMSVHLRPYARHAAQRRAQLERALGILHDVEDELGAHVVLLGDLNTTGFAGEPEGEREEIEDVVVSKGFTLPTADIDCSEYWRPTGSDRYVPSVLDHIVIRSGDWGDPEVMGMCAELACEAIDADEMHDDYERASDHCPVRIHGDW